MYFLSVGMSCTPSWTHSRAVIKMALNQAHEIVGGLPHSPSLSVAFFSGFPLLHLIPHRMYSLHSSGSHDLFNKPIQS